MRGFRKEADSFAGLENCRTPKNESHLYSITPGGELAIVLGTYKELERNYFYNLGIVRPMWG